MSKTFYFPVVAWDDIEGRDVWVADITATIDDPLAAQYENEAFLDELRDELGDVHVVRSVA